MMDKTCACGCGEPIRWSCGQERRFAFNACRQRAYRQRRPTPATVRPETLATLRALVCELRKHQKDVRRLVGELREPDITARVFYAGGNLDIPLPVSFFEELLTASE